MIIVNGGRYVEVTVGMVRATLSDLVCKPVSDEYGFDPECGLINYLNACYYDLQGP